MAEERWLKTLVRAIRFSAERDLWFSAMAKGTVTLVEAIEASQGREPYVARSVHPPCKICVYDGPEFAEEKARELDARVIHTVMRQRNISATFSVIVADDPSIPFDPIPVSELGGRSPALAVS